MAALAPYLQMVPGANLLGFGNLFNDFIIRLDGVSVDDFAVPGEINGGSGQTVNIHKYPGGVRTIDSFGADPKQITWSGRFMSIQAETLAQQLETICTQGLQVSLVWSRKNFLVVVTDFTYRFLNYYDIPYTITMDVVADLNQQAPTSSVEDADGQVQSDQSATQASGSDIQVGGLY